MRAVLQAGLAALASLVLPVVGALLLVFGDPVVQGRSVDDAAERSALLFLLAVPLAVPPLGAYFVAVAAAVRWTGPVSLRRLLVANAIIVALLCLAVASQDLSSLRSGDLALPMLALSACAYACLALGSIAWAAAGRKKQTPR